MVGKNAWGNKSVSSRRCNNNAAYSLAGASRARAYRAGMDAENLEVPDHLIVDLVPGLDVEIEPPRGAEVELGSLED